MHTKVLEKKDHRLPVSLKLGKHIKAQPQVTASLEDVQKSLSKIGVSLSKRVVEEREDHIK